MRKGLGRIWASGAGSALREQKVRFGEGAETTREARALPIESRARPTDIALPPVTLSSFHDTSHCKRQVLIRAMILDIEACPSGGRASRVQFHPLRCTSGHPEQITSVIEQRAWAGGR